MSHTLFIGQQVKINIDKLDTDTAPVFTITGFTRYNQFDMNGNEMVNLLTVNDQFQFTALQVHFSLLIPK